MKLYRLVQEFTVEILRSLGVPRIIITGCWYDMELFDMTSSIFTFVLFIYLFIYSAVLPGATKSWFVLKTKDINSGPLVTGSL
jgi:hypothetical protein